MTDPCHYIDAADLPRVRSVAIYGCGAFGAELLDLLKEERPDLTVPFFIDSAKKGEQNGLPVIPLDDFAAMKPDTADLVLIASYYWEDILAGLTPDLRNKAAIADQRILRKRRIKAGLEPHFPAISIELSTYCDMDCDFCMHRLMPGRNRHMDRDLLFQILDDIHTHNLTREVGLVGFGETLLCPHLDDALERCRELGLISTICTNGLQLTPKRHRELVDHGLNGDLYVSLQNLSAEGFQYRNPKNKKSFEDFYAQILACVGQHMEHGFEHTLTIPLLVAHNDCPVANLWDLPGLIEDTQHHMERFKRLADDLHGLALKHGVDIDIPQAEYEQALSSVHGNAMGGRLLPIGDRLRLYLVPLIHRTPSVMNLMCADRMDTYRFIPGKSTKCPSFGAPQITVNGDLLPCCWIPGDSDEYARHVMGNIRETPILDIIGSKRWQRFFSLGEKGLFPGKICQGCLGTYEKK